MAARRHFRKLLDRQWEEGRFLCAGLDPDPAKIPASLRRADLGETLLAFNTMIVDATREIVGCYKPNSAFYEAHGERGWAALRETISYINKTAPEKPVILDCKRADIGNTNSGYAAAAYDDLGADAVTVHPYLGAEAIEPFVAREEKGVIVLCRTSNPGAAEFQDLAVGGDPLYMHVARAVAQRWNARGNCGLVVGATYPEELRRIREEAPDLPILIPGVGAQGGDLAASVENGRDGRGRGIIVSVSRALIYAGTDSDVSAEVHRKARELDGEIRAVV